MEQAVINNWLKTLLIIIGVVAFGLVALNQGMAYFYKTNLMGSPCQLCVKLNPDWQQCYDWVTRPIKVNSSYAEINYSKLDGMLVSPKP